MRRFTLLKTVLMAVVMLAGFSVNAEAQGTESFSHSSTSSSYGTFSWTGTNGLAWSATDARGDQVITTGNKAVCVRTGSITGALTPAQQAAGIGTLKFDYKIPFSDDTKSITVTITAGSTVITKVLGLLSVGALNKTGDINIGSINPANLVLTVSSNASGARLVIDNLVWTANSTVTPSAAAPTFTPAPGTYYSAQSVTLSSTTTGSNIYYTTDGSDPTSASTLYTGAIYVATTTTIKAIAYDASDANPSAVVTADYIIATPTITVTETTIPEMAAVVGEAFDTRTITVGGNNLTNDIKLAIIGTDAAQFSVTPITISKGTGTVADQTATITYTPTAAGSHTATLEITSIDAVSITRTLTGTATAPTLDAPVATDETGVSQSGFTANWNAVTGATEYQLNVYTNSGTVSTPVFSENFNGFTAGNIDTPDGTDVGTSLNAYTQTAGWTGSKVYQAGGTAKMGTTSALGTITTPAVDLTGTNIALNFSVMGWNGDATSIVVKLDGVSIATPTIVNDQATWTPVSLTITGGTATSKITFEGAKASKGRFLLNDLVISKDLSGKAPIPGSPFTGITTNSWDVTGLSNANTYYYTVTAKNATLTSAVSNEIEVALTLTGLKSVKDARVWTANGKVLFTAAARETVEIYNTVGQKLVSRTATEGLNQISLNARGVLVVKINNSIAKVVL